MDSSSSSQKYYELLAKLPMSGGGGLHRFLLKISNVAARCGVEARQVEQDLIRSVRGTRSVPEREIQEAVKKAYIENSYYLPNGQRYQTYVRPIPKPLFNGDEVFNHTIAGVSVTQDNITFVSPVRVPKEPHQQLAAFLRCLYDEQEIIFMGSRYKSNSLYRVHHAIDTAASILEHVEHFVINPLSGKPAPTKSDPNKLTYRGDRCVTHHRYTVAEMDDRPKVSQLRFWATQNLVKLRALIDSGGKSIHAIIQVDAPDYEQWHEQVERKLFPQILVPLGVDPACKNPARLSRTPGALRPTSNRQELIWLSNTPRLIYDY